ncbi:MAG TPA: 30S ribosomal protein S16 [Planctomycetota bacterium]|nr:30S ribosomal protein S16 [Planctomycetota bacterium]
MAVMIRLKRFGRRNRPSWRIAVMDKRNARDGESIEEIGTYDNVTDPKQTKVVVKAERARYWLSVGAQPSRMVHHIFKRNGVYAKAETPAAAPAAAPAKKK